MTEELAGMKRYIESTGRAETLLERENFILVKWDNPYNPGIRYCLHAFPYGKSGMANNDPWRCDLTDEQAEYFLAHPDNAEEYFKYKHSHFSSALINFWSIDGVRDINENGIEFMHGHFVAFAECVQLIKRFRPENECCIGERSITAKPPIIEFQSPSYRDIVLFNGRGMLSERKNAANFRKLCRLIERYGYSTIEIDTN